MSNAASAQQTRNFKAVQRYVTNAVKQVFAPTRVVKINMREGKASSDGRPIYRIDIIYDGNLPEPSKFTDMVMAMRQHFWEIEEERDPYFSFLTPADEEWFYAGH